MTGSEGAPGEGAACSTAHGSQRPRSLLETAGCSDALEVRVCSRKLLRQLSYEHVLTFYDNSAMQEKRPLVALLLF